MGQVALAGPGQARAVPTAPTPTVAFDAPRPA